MKETAFCRNCGHAEGYDPQAGDKPATGNGDFHYLYGKDCPTCHGEENFREHTDNRQRASEGTPPEVLAQEYWVRQGYTPCPIEDMVRIWKKENRII